MKKLLVFAAALSLVGAVTAPAQARPWHHWHHHHCHHWGHGHRCDRW